MSDELDLILRRLAHDLRAPVRGVRGFTKLVVGRLPAERPPVVDEYLGYIDQCAVHMGDLIDGMSAYGRAGHDLHIAEVSLSSCWRDALETVAPLPDGASVTADDDLPAVKADRAALAQVLENLLRNALLYSEGPPVVHLSAAEEGGGCRLSLRDEGLGVAPEFHDDVFELLRRLHTRDEYPGVGVGLALCKKIVEGHGGRIWIESALGAGTTVHVWLPSDAET